MPYSLPPHVEKNAVHGKVYFYFRIRAGNGPRIPLPDDPTSEEFRQAYSLALATPLPAVQQDPPGSIGALIDSYLKSGQFAALRETTKVGYQSRLATMRENHGHRLVSAMTRDRIKTFVLDPLANKPGACLDTLKKLRILIKHAIDKGWLKNDPSAGIKRAKTKEIRAWTDGELEAFEQRWPLGTKQRAAYELMLNFGTARVDTHALTWRQADAAGYERHKTGVPVCVVITDRLQAALAEIPRRHLTVINTTYGKPFTVDGFSRWMRDAITAAGLPLECQPHGLRKTLGRMLADLGCTTHEIMSALGHTTLAEAERYTKEADRRRNGQRAFERLQNKRFPKPSSNLPKKIEIK
jgi:integrase